MSRAVLDITMKGIVLEVLGKEEGEKILAEFDPWTLGGYDLGKEEKVLLPHLEAVHPFLLGGNFAGQAISRYFRGKTLEMVLKHTIVAMQAVEFFWSSMRLRYPSQLTLGLRRTEEGFVLVEFVDTEEEEDGLTSFLRKLRI